MEYNTDYNIGLHPPIICLFRLLLDVAPSLLLVLGYGTIYLRTLPPHLTVAKRHLKISPFLP